jgi:hypothetical protein
LYAPLDFLTLNWILLFACHSCVRFLPRSSPALSGPTAVVKVCECTSPAQNFTCNSMYAKHCMKCWKSNYQRRRAGCETGCLICLLLVVRQRFVGGARLVQNNSAVCRGEEGAQNHMGRCRSNGQQYSKQLAVMDVVRVFSARRVLSQQWSISYERRLLRNNGLCVQVDPSIRPLRRLTRST